MLGAAIVISAAFATSMAVAQSQDQPSPSLGDYARKVHKDPSTVAKPKVYDNDNLPKDNKLSVVGPAPAVDADSVAASDKSSSADSKAPAEKAADGKAVAKPIDDEQARKQAEWKGWQGKISGEKDQIDMTSRELDVTQREYQLRAAAIYADAGNRMRNAAAWDKEDADYKQKIADKQKTLDELKQKLNDLQDQARKAGVPASMTE
jgi:uncharacterized low-complexity protein